MLTAYAFRLSYLEMCCHAQLHWTINHVTTSRK